MLQGLGTFLIGNAMFGSMMVAIYGLIVAHQSLQSNVSNARTIKTLEVNTNSKLEQLLKVTGESEHAKGVIQGKSESV
jgi:hypothetical protein